MSKLVFSENKSIRLGVEVEIQLIAPETGDLYPVGPAILDSLKNDLEATHIKSEIFQSMLEIDTPICENAYEVGASLRASLKTVRDSAKAHGAEVMMAGTHPFAHYSDRILTPSSRYFSLVDRNKWITRRLQIFGLHVHLGMKNGEHAIMMNNALCHYLPILLAISASSPYWHREDTGLASSRITFFEAIPTGGHPCLVGSWVEFEDLVARLVHSKSIQSIKDLWWDIRPNLEFGTIEVRIADCPPTIKEVESLVALIHSLAVFIDRELTSGRKFSPPPEWLLRENKWRASRHGVQCELIKDLEGNSVPFPEIWAEVVSSLNQISTEFNYDSFFAFIGAVIAKGPSYVRQREHFKNGFESVIQHLVLENCTDHPLWSTK
ncbi:MAG: hypothetical protein B7Y39_02490 [Bdellovibrio sp. 28-41-41]|nr:MAG: hypothetical protein B7Y39_02490 [Bdellovibrio sp. 28-41-41]